MTNTTQNIEFFLERYEVGTEVVLRRGYGRETTKLPRELTGTVIKVEAKNLRISLDETGPIFIDTGVTDLGHRHIRVKADGEVRSIFDGGTESWMYIRERNSYSILRHYKFAGTREELVENKRQCDVFNIHWLDRNRREELEHAVEVMKKDMQRKIHELDELKRNVEEYWNGDTTYTDIERVSDFDRNLHHNLNVTDFMRVVKTAAEHMRKVSEYRLRYGADVPEPDEDMKRHLGYDESESNS